MLGRAAVSEEVLAELGYLTIAYGGLEEMLADFTSALLNPGDQKVAWEVISRMAFSTKVETLRRLFGIRCEQSGVGSIIDMKRALDVITKAGAARNELVHGFADLTQAGVLTTRPGHKPRPITLDNVKSVNQLIFEADQEFLEVFVPFWNETKGRFCRDDPPDADAE